MLNAEMLRRVDQFTERLDAEQVTGPYQAFVFNLPLDAGHRSMTDRYFEAHLEMRELLELDWRGPEPDKP